MMSRGVELPWKILGRRIRPFSFALMLATLVAAVEFAQAETGPGSGLTEAFAGGFGYLAVTLLLLGWITVNDDLHDWGLLVAAGVWGGRATLFFLDSEFDDVGAYLSVCWAVGALGAYALERYDHKSRFSVANER